MHFFVPLLNTNVASQSMCHAAATSNDTYRALREEWAGDDRRKPSDLTKMTCE